jgi:hypothetical protein
MSTSNGTQPKHYTFYHMFTHPSCGRVFLTPVTKLSSEIPQGFDETLRRIINGAKYRCFYTSPEEIQRLESDTRCPRCNEAGVKFDPLP